MKKLYVVVYFILFGSLHAAASPNSLNYQGRILKTDGTPLEYEAVIFNFKIMDPSGQYVLWEENANPIDMTGSKGLFDVPLGEGARTFPDMNIANIDNSYWTNFSLIQSFDNTHSFYCKGSTLPSCYSPVGGDMRLLRVRFWDGVAWRQISPDTKIRSVPYSAFAESAEKLAGKSLNEFILKATIPNCGAGSFLTWSTATQNFGCSVVNVSSGDITSVDAGKITGVIDADRIPDLDWSKINSGKPTTLAGYGITDAMTSVAVTSPLLSSGGLNPTLSIQQANTNQGGYLSSTDWNVFNNKQAAGNYLTALSGDVTASGPGSAATSIGKLQGYALTLNSPAASQFLKYNGSAFVNSTIAISDVISLSSSLDNKIDASQMPANCGANQTLTFSSPVGIWSCANIAITGSALGSQTGNTFLAAPNGAPGTPVFRGIAAADIPVLDWSKITTGKPVTLAGYGITDAMTSVSVSSPLQSSGGLNPTLSIQQASSTQAGSLSSADWNTFNNKQPAGNYVTALVGDVSASGPGSASSSIVKLQGSTLTISAPAASQYLRYNGSAFVNATIPAADVPALDWTKITTGKPTTIAGYGITDGFTQGGNSFAGAAILGTNNANNLTFETNNVVRATLDTSGRLGIGVTPSQALHVAGNIQVDNGTNAAIYNSGGMYFSGVPGAATHANYIFRPGWGTAGNRLATITVQNSDTAGNYNDCVQLSSFGSSYFNCGGLGLGTKNPSGQLEVVGRIRATNAPGDSALYEMYNNSAVANQRWTEMYTDNNGIFVIRNMNDTYTAGATILHSHRLAGSPNIDYTVLDGNVGIGMAPSYKLFANGTVAGIGAYVNASDIRYKENVQPLADVHDKLSRLTGVSFDWRQKDYPELNFEQIHDIGVIAQEVEKVFPEAVKTDKKGYKSVAYSKLVAPLIEAVKELYAKVSGHDEEIAALKKENADLKARLDRLEKAYTPR